jgi:hypothetical protein
VQDVPVSQKGLAEVRILFLRLGHELSTTNISLSPPIDRIKIQPHGQQTLTTDSSRKFNGDESFVAFPDEPAAATESSKL